MTLNKAKRRMKQVSLAFKNLPEEVSNEIEKLDKSPLEENEDDCKIVSVNSNAESKNSKIDWFFQNRSPKKTKATKETVFKELNVNVKVKEEKFKNRSSSPKKLSDENKADYSMEDEEENDESKLLTEEESSSSSDDEDEDEEDEEDDDEDENSEEDADATFDNDDLQVLQVEKSASGGNDAEKRAQPCDPADDAAPPKKKRRPSSVVQAEKKEMEMERARRRVEKEAARRERLAEKERVRLEKKCRRARLAAEREASRLQVEKEKEARRRKREEAKRERERLKEEERLKKEEEKRKREEEKVQLENAKKEKEEAKKQEQERKIEKQASFFNKFFIKNTTSEKPSTDSEEKELPEASIRSPFIQFHVKKGMRLAPHVRHPPGKLRELKRNIDNTLKSAPSKDPSNLYLSELQSGRRKPMSAQRTWPMMTKTDDIEFIGAGDCASSSKWYRAKLLLFAENYRPPFYGTFRRQSHIITGRRPFLKDIDLVDYDVDSDEEWAENEPGESLSHSEGDDDEDDDQDEENDGFFVPHGYLSEDEGAEDEEDKLTPEMRKIQQQLSEARFEESMKKKIQLLKNIVVPPSVDASQHPLLLALKVVELTDVFPIPISISSISVSSSGRSTGKNGVPEEAMADLVRLVHGNKLGMKKILFEFRMFWEHKISDRLPEVTYDEDLKGRDWKEFSISKSQLERKIREIASWEVMCWHVNSETLAQYPTDDVNSWEYVTDVALRPLRKRKIKSPIPTKASGSPNVIVLSPTPEKKPGPSTSGSTLPNKGKGTPKKPIYSYFSEGRDTADKKGIKKFSVSIEKAAEEENAESKKSQSDSSQSRLTSLKAAPKKAPNQKLKKALPTDSTDEKRAAGGKKSAPRKEPIPKGKATTSKEGGNSKAAATKAAPKKEIAQKIKLDFLKEGNTIKDSFAKKASVRKGKADPAVKRLNVLKTKPLKTKVPQKRQTSEKENEDNDCEIIDLCDS